MGEDKKYFIKLNGKDVEVNEQQRDVIRRSNWNEHYSNRKYNRHICSGYDVDLISSDNALNPESLFVDKIEKDMLSKAISMLTEEERILIKYIFYMELTYREIEDITGIPKSTSHDRIRKILLKLREHMIKLGHDAY